MIRVNNHRTLGAKHVPPYTVITVRVGDATVMLTDIDNFSVLPGPIQSYRGTINDFIGDAIPTTCNLPGADAQHPENTVRRALEIQHRLETERLPGGRVPRTRAGIDTGPVVAGSLGPRNRLIYVVLGDEVTVAAAWTP